MLVSPDMMKAVKMQAKLLQKDDGPVRYSVKEVLESIDPQVDVMQEMQTRAPHMEDKQIRSAQALRKLAMELYRSGIKRTYMQGWGNTYGRATSKSSKKELSPSSMSGDRSSDRPLSFCTPDSSLCAG